MSVEVQMEQQDNNRQLTYLVKKSISHYHLHGSVQSKMWKKYTEKVKCYFICLEVHAIR